MLHDKSFQKGFLIVQLLGIILIGAVTVPFAIDLFEDWSKLPQFPIWVIEIFLAILTIIFIVVGVKVSMIADNKFKYLHLSLSVVITILYAIELYFCFVRMGA